MHQLGEENERMLEALEKDFPLDSEENMEKRKLAVETLEQTIADWTYELGVTNAGLDEVTARQASGKLFVFGSYRLGVVTATSDIDAVCVCPKHVNRDHFFNILGPKLGELDGVTELIIRSEAHTPIICFNIFGIPVDLGFCRLNVSILKDLESLEDDGLLLGQDEQGARAMGGVGGCIECCVGGVISPGLSGKCRLA